MESSAARSLSAGVISGACCTFLLQPLDVLKTRQQMVALSRGGTSRWTQVLVGVLVKERPLVLWSGVSASLCRVVPGVGVYFCCLQSLRQSQLLATESSSPLTSLVTAAASRTVAATLTAPFTLVKTHFESGRYGYRSVWSAVAAVYSSHGRSGLMKGLLPTLVRDVPFSAVYYTIFQECRSYLTGCDWRLSTTPASGPGQYDSLVTLASGLWAGVLASLATHPADVIKTHVQLRRHSPSTAGDCSLAETLRQVYSESGWRVFLSGLAARTLRRTLAAAVTWTLFERVNGTLR